MTRQEKRALFAGCMPATMAALKIDGNEWRLEFAWQADDLDEMLARLRLFHRSLGLSTLWLTQASGDAIIARIAADALLVCERVGWSWINLHSEAKGTC